MNANSDRKEGEVLQVLISLGAHKGGMGNTNESLNICLSPAISNFPLSTFILCLIPIFVS